MERNLLALRVEDPAAKIAALCLSLMDARAVEVPS
jgi:hypothetical protein